MIILKPIISIVFLIILFCSSVTAQQIVYPAKGQSVVQQQKDEAECYTWAKNKTGYDPAQATQNAVTSRYNGGLLGDATRGALGGAAGGAAIGAIAGDAGKGAAIGAIGGLLFGGTRNRWKQDNYDQVAAQQQQYTAQQQQYYQNAYSACFEGRGYTVR